MCIYMCVHGVVCLLVTERLVAMDAGGCCDGCCDSGSSLSRPVEEHLLRVRHMCALSKFTLPPRYTLTHTHTHTHHNILRAPHPPHGHKCIPPPPPWVPSVLRPPQGAVVQLYKM